MDVTTSGNDIFTKDWIINELGLLQHHEDTIRKALELKQSLAELKQSYFPELSHYFPQSLSEIEIQQFNLNIMLPKRLLPPPQPPVSQSTPSMSTPSNYAHANQLLGKNSNLGPSTMSSKSSQMSANSASNNNSTSTSIAITPSHAEIIAFWILEHRDLLNSNSLCNFLQNYSYQNILYSIAMKICSLDIGQHFIDGLKYYLPVCGFWNLTFIHHPNYSPEILNYILEMYVKAHLNTSEKPLLSNTLDHFNALMEIGKATIELCQSLQEEKKSSTVMMSDYYQKVRLALRKTDGMTLSVKSINSLFMNASSSLITDIIPVTTSAVGVQGAKLTSYLFTSIRKVGVLGIGINLYEENFPLYEVYLCSNAMYLFQPPSLHPQERGGNIQVGKERKKLFAVIPLKNIYVEKSQSMNEREEMYHHQGTIELSDKFGEKVCWILYDECSTSISSDSDGKKEKEDIFFDIPISIEYFDQFVLRISESNLMEEWLDVFQDCCWQA